MKQLSAKKITLNALLFKIGWWSCVILGSQNQANLAFVLGLCLLMIHFMYVSIHRVRDLKVIISITAVGFVIDSLLSYLGVFQFPQNAENNFFAPIWLVSLWMLFATTLEYSLRKLENKPWSSFLFGFLGGPVSYAAGRGFEILVFPNHFYISLLIVGLIWGLLVPGLYSILKRVR